MQILYLWIKKFKNLENVGIPFVGEYLFEEEYNNDGQLKHIIMKKNEEFVSNLFELNNLSSVTLLVGKNGSGKTSIIELLRVLFAAGDRITYQEVLIVYSDDAIWNRKVKVHKASSINADVIFDNILLDSKDYDINPPVHLQPQIELNNPPSIIHYSNTLSFQSPVEYAGVIDITTAGLLENDSHVHETKLSMGTSQVQAHISAELERNVSFLYGSRSQSRRKDIEDFIPYELSIAPIRQPLNAMIDTLKDKQYEGNIKNIYEILSRESIDAKEVFFNGIILGIIFSWLYQNIYIQTSDFLKVFEEALKQTEYGSNQYTSIMSRINNALGQSYVNSIFKSAEQLIQLLESSLKKEELILATAPLGMVVKNRDSHGRELLRQIVAFHKGASGFISFLDFHWINRIKGESIFRRLSAGEQARLSFFSRLNDAVEGRCKKEDLGANILLLIDEGDTYYHPEWQRHFFSDVLNSVRWFFREKSVQLVITTNAPFMVSDLPHWSIVCLEQNEKRIIKAMRPSKPNERTFAQNIHTLLSNDFYMNFTVGDFAKGKVDRIITQLSSSDSKKMEDIDKIIDLIGEPILRNKLVEMSISKYDIDSEIKSLENRLNDLRKMRDDSNKQE